MVRRNQFLTVIKSFLLIGLFFVGLGVLLTPQTISAQTTHEPELEILSVKQDLHVLIFAHSFPPSLDLQVSLRPMGTPSEDTVEILSVNSEERGYFFQVIHIPPSLVGEPHIEIRLQDNDQIYTVENNFNNKTFEDDQVVRLARKIIQQAEVAQEHDDRDDNEANHNDPIIPAPKTPAPTTEEIASTWLQSGGKEGDWEDPVLFIWPAEKRWLSGYNYTATHPGIDIAAREDDLVFSAASGKVVEVNFSNRGYGNMVLIEHLNGYQTLYAHLNSILVETGSFVFQGQPIGLAGSTGNSTGVHLHFEIRFQGEFINPWLFLNR